MKKAATTMFPSNWNEERIKNELKGAWYSKDFKIQTTERGKGWSGTTPSGIKIEGFINKDKIVAFPKYKGD